ncbi:unnamed protein product [Adineta ricciae]|uniref:Phosphotransferase n=1 Tax=Adineta ricciae TaxID=249248 RepID=A0A813ZQ14_ADIRI|nr:unnamed protein product [Adineta ricciae]CAF0982126.1 unnamed protein product [Adineta ricciae]
MSTLATILQDEISTATLQKGLYAIAACTLIGAAAYAGYKAAEPETKHLPSHRHPESNEQIEKVLEALRLDDDDKLRVIMQSLEREMELGLSPATHPTADVKMFATYVRSTADGSETGQVLALDLGGTNFRVLLVDLLPQSKVELTSKIFVIPQSIMLGEGSYLFRHLADCLMEFMNKENLNKPGVRYPLGFTFSFPCKQEGLASARLSTWTKGFTCSGVVNEDVVKMLQVAIDEKNINVQCVALVNDTVGTLMACAYKDPNTEIGLILGTGTNACYMEKLDRVGTWDGDYNDPKQVIINMEWGAFGNNHRLNHIRTKYDEEVDLSSVNPGKQIFEKMISGMYMGEIVRLIMLDLIHQNLLFIGKCNGSEDFKTPLFTRGGFYTKYVSSVEMDEGIGFSNTRRVLEDIGIRNPSYDDCAIVQHICKIVSKRAARLAGAGLAVLINRINKPNVTVGVDGSLYRYHPRFKRNMEKCMQNLVSKNIKFLLQLSNDGSGIGAALTVAAAEALSNQEKTKRSYPLSDDGSGKGAGLIAVVASRYLQQLSQSTSTLHNHNNEKVPTQFQKHLSTLQSPM